MTEHSAVIFVFFFLAEYASIVLMCILISILYLGGYNYDYNLVNYLIDAVYLNISDIIDLIWEFSLYAWNYLYSLYYGINTVSVSDTDLVATRSMNIRIEDMTMKDESLYIDSYLTNPLTANLIYAFVIGFKTLIMIFIFIWVRASFPRIRFDQLMSYCWTVLLPIVFAFIILIPCILYSFEMFPVNVLFF